MTRAKDDTTLEFERTLLATMMLRPADCWRVEVQPEHLVSEQHAEILTAIRSMSQDSMPVDPVTVCDHFEQAGKRGLGNLALTIGGQTITTATPEAYGHRIIAGYRQRKARDIGAELVASTDPTAVDRAIAALMNLHATEQAHEFSAKEAAKLAADELNRIHEAGGKLAGITSGLSDLDDKLGGFHNGDLIVVGGRAAMGKTSFLLGAATIAAESGIPVGMISGEQPAQQMATRMVSATSHVGSVKFRTAQFAEEEWPRVLRGFGAVGKLPLWFLDRSAPTLAEVVRTSRRWVHQHGIKALYVDYLQRIVGEGERKHEQVGSVARGLKNLARDLEIPVIVLAQVSRDAEKGAGNVPKMSHLSDSSEIEKEADQVLMLFRPSYYDENADPGVARVIVEKNRHGPTGYVDVAWLGETMTFKDLARETGRYEGRISRDAGEDHTTRGGSAGITR